MVWSEGDVHFSRKACQNPCRGCAADLVKPEDGMDLREGQPDVHPQF